jgi:hypothetical protein
MVLILVIIAQVLGKSVINKIWAYFCTIQIYLMFKSYHSQKWPANIDLMFTQTDSLINLSSLPKEDIKEFVLKKG